MLALPGIRPQFLSPSSGSLNLMLAKVTKLLQLQLSKLSGLKCSRDRC
jgi:hypothetical protein